MCPGGSAGTIIPGSFNTYCPDGSVFDMMGNIITQGSGSGTNNSGSGGGGGLLDFLKDVVSNVDDIILATKGKTSDAGTTVINNQLPGQNGSSSKLPVWAVALMSIFGLGFIIAMFALARKGKKSK